MIEAIFFDIDGTLVSHNKNEVSASTREGLQLLQQRGVRRIIATGRHISELASLPLADLDFDGYITLNGQLCYDHHKQLIFGNPITGREKDALIKVFQEKTIPIMLIEEDRMYANHIVQRLADAQNAQSARIPPLGEYTGNAIYQAVAFVDPAEKEMLTQLLPGCQVTYWNPYAVDIVPRIAGKVAGICQYLDRAGIDRENTMSFGDGENDMDMLAFSGIGVAMGNADPHVKDCADYVTGHIDEDGIFHALKHFGVI